MEALGLALQALVLLKLLVTGAAVVTPPEPPAVEQAADAASAPCSASRVA